MNRKESRLNRAAKELIPELVTQLSDEELRALGLQRDTSRLIQEMSPELRHEKIKESLVGFMARLPGPEFEKLLAEIEKVRPV